MNSVEETSPGVWVVHFATRDTVTREGSQPLLGPLIAASKTGPILLLADLPADVTLIPPTMVTLWLEAMLSGGLRVGAIGVVTKSRAVRAVASAFQAAMRVRERPIAAEVRPTLDELKVWANEHVKTLR